MNQFNIAPRADEIYKFTGELLQRVNWKYENIAYSGYTKIYKTHADNLVVEIKRWVDESHHTPNTKHECVVLNIGEVLAWSNHTWFKRLVKGTAADYIRTQIEKKFPSCLYPRGVLETMTNIILYHLGLNPHLERPV